MATTRHPVLGQTAQRKVTVLYSHALTAAAVLT